MRPQTYIEDYGEGRYKLQVAKIPMPEPGTLRDGPKRSNDEKLFKNLCRAKSTVFDLAYCNPWDWFVTVTISPEKYKRTDLHSFHKAYGQFLRHEARHIGDKLDYLMVPEQHKKPGWHEHGFIRGLPVEELRPFTLDEKVTNYIRGKLKEGREVYDWPRYRARFGFCDLEPIRSRKAAAAYCSKYISKTMLNNVTAVGAHTYYASKGLIRPYRVASGTAMVDMPDPEFENGYCKGKWYSSYDEAMAELMRITKGTATMGGKQDDVRGCVDVLGGEKRLGENLAG